MSALEQKQFSNMNRVSVPVPTKIIYDESQVVRMEQICQQLFTQECDPQKLPAMVVSLSARQKYVKMKLPHDGFFRRTLLSGSCNLLQKVKEMEKPEPYYLRVKSNRFDETENGNGKQGNYPSDLVEIPQEALACYLTFNPRSQLIVLNNMNQRMMNQYLTGVEFKKGGLNLQNELVTELQKSKQPLVKCYELDIDTKDFKIISAFNRDCVKAKVKSAKESKEASAQEFTQIQISSGDLESLESPLFADLFFILETHSGFHLVYRKGKDMQLFYKILKADAENNPLESRKYQFSGTSRDGQPVVKKYIEVLSDPCFSIPGTLQGNFPVRFVDLEEFKSEIQCDESGPVKSMNMPFDFESEETDTSQSQNLWIIDKFYVEKGDHIVHGQPICRVNCPHKNVQMEVFSTLSGKVVHLFNSGQCPAGVTQFSCKCLIKVNVNDNTQQSLI